VAGWAPLAATRDRNTPDLDAARCRVAPHRPAGDQTASRLPMSPMTLASAPTLRLPRYRDDSRQAHGHLCRPIQGCSTTPLDGRVDPEARGRGDAGADCYPFWRLLAQPGASRAGQARVVSSLVSFPGMAGHQGLTIRIGTMLPACRRSKIAPRRTNAATILPTGARRKGRLFMKSICNNCKNGLPGRNFGRLQGGLLHQDHTWAAIRQGRLHLVASAKISA
jgi:hypothetical protein